MTLEAFEQLKRSKDLPTPAGVGMRILELTRTEDYSAHEMAETILADSSLTGRILRLANSAGMSGAEPVTTVSEAIMRLGGSTVRDLSLAFCLVSERETSGCLGFDYELYWARSLARAVTAQALCRLGSAFKPEEAYICGLLGEIGRLALASVHVQRYSELLACDAVQDTQRLLQDERNAFGIDHAQLSACMLVEWGLPTSFAQAVESLCNATTHTGTIEGLDHVLYYAHALAEAFTIPDSASDVEWADVGDRLQGLRGVLDMEPEAFVTFGNRCAKEWVSWGEVLGVPTGAAPDFAAVLARSAAALGSTSPRKPTTAAASRLLPAATPPPLRERSTRYASPVARDSIRILVVDQDEELVAGLREQLREEGYAVRVAGGAREGVRAALASPPDIILAAKDLPDQDGLEMCTALRRSHAGRRMYFLLLVEHETEELLGHAFDAGVDDFVTKPVVPRVLAARIKGGVRLARLQRKIEQDKQTMMKQVTDLGSMTRRLRSASLTDPLTELWNRRYAMKRLENEWASAQRTGKIMSTLMVDIDHFKAVNDNYGHDVGDLVLKEVTGLLKAAVRASDDVCRWGGEEFLVICKHTDDDGALRTAERIRSTIAEHVLPPPHYGTVTASIGVAASVGVESVEALIKAADEAVYLAKDAGRNRVCTAGDVTRRRKSA